MRRLLILRPEPGATATAERARELGLEAVAIPLFKIEAVEWTVPEASAFDALLLTSANAIRCAGPALSLLRGLPVHAVGRATSDAAREAGFDVGSTGDSGIDRLLGSLGPELNLLHLCGEDRRLPEQPRQRITAIPVYRAAQIAADLRGVAGAVALVHSLRAGARFAKLIDEAQVDRASVTVATISEAARQWTGDGWAGVEIAEQPDDEALLALAARLCNKPDGK